MDWSDSDKSMLTWAINIVLAAPDIPVKDCKDLEAKLQSIASARSKAEVENQIKTAAVRIDESDAYGVWQKTKPRLRLWKTAFEMRQVPSRDPGKQLPRTQKAAMKYATNSFDISILKGPHFDFLLLLAFANIEPVSLERFNELYEKCPQIRSEGTKIRSLVHRWMRKDSDLSNLVLQDEGSRTKRGLEEDSDNRRTKRIRQAPALHTSFNPEPLYDIGSDFDATMDVITGLPPFDYDSSIYNLHANTMPTSLPDSTWTAKPPS